MDTKECSRCKVVKEVSYFSKRSDRKCGVRSACKDCEKVVLENDGGNSKRYQHTYYQENKELIKERHKKYWKKEGFNKNLLRKFNITETQYDGMLEEQEGRCYICGEYETAINCQSGEVQRLAVDHCHKTGRVRVLLCASCNLLVGHIEKKQKNIIPNLIEFFKTYTLED